MFQKNLFDIKSFVIDLTFGFWHLAFIVNSMSKVHVLDL